MIRNNFTSTKSYRYQNNENYGARTDYNINLQQKYGLPYNWLQKLPKNVNIRKMRTPYYQVFKEATKNIEISWDQLNG